MESKAEEHAEIVNLTNNKIEAIETETLLEVLQSKFGFKHFRSGQLTAIKSLLQRERLLSIQPTGHGKSLLYQLPSTLLKGMTLVISPLLALMRDQLEQLNRRFQIPAISINSDQTELENKDARYLLLQNKVKILFIAPEQLGNLEQCQFLSQLPIDLIVVDEAHCISTWGHDFRPEYREILKFIVAVQTKNPHLNVLGLTATADKRTEHDIKQQLSTMDKAMMVHRESMDRPNIALSVLLASDRAEKLALCEALVIRFSTDACFEQPKSGLIYCATRENTELVADYLKAVGIKAEYYHAGIEPNRKRQLQQEFISNKHALLVATNALGMGIDKQNLRFIIHYDFPGSITAYYQEVGRCGRDGQHANGVLLYCPQDKQIQQYFINAALPSMNDFNQILKTLNAKSLNLTDIKTSTGLHPTRVNVVVHELTQQNFLNKCHMNGRQVYQRTQHLGNPDISRYQTLFHHKINELNKMVHYCRQDANCRMLLLRQHLGEPEAKKACLECDICKKIAPPSMDAKKIRLILDWQETRNAPIHLTKHLHIAPGFSLFDGNSRSSSFVNFMKSRAALDITAHSTLLEKIINALEEKIKILNQELPIGAALVVPSRTWSSREFIATTLANRLKIPFLVNALKWKEIPKARQGALLNNEQRRDNVRGKMQFFNTPMHSKAILLFDDYIGSGATLKEAARAIRQGGVKQTLIPITIASIKWKLGQTGMV